VNFDYGERAGGTTNMVVSNFQAFAQTVTVADSSGYVDVALVGRTAPQALDYQLNNYPWPLIAYATFNTLSFTDRTATIGQTNLEYFMIYQPMAKCPGGDLPCIDSLVFTLPAQFGYPPVSNLDDCQIQSNLQPLTVPCSLTRVNNDKYVTFQPYEAESSQYYHQISMVTLENQPVGFTAPQYPGTQYTITVSAYSGSTLVEQATTNLSNVLGYPLYLEPNFDVTTGLDGGQMSMYEVTFDTGVAEVPAGYDSASFTLYSNVILTFDTSAPNTFTNDLGTG
jgi:hypothetical protein